WDPATDTFRVNFANSLQLDSISLQTGLSRDQLIVELWRRKEILEWMKQNKVLDNKDVSRIILNYYADPEKLLSEIGVSLRRPVVQTFVSQASAAPHPPVKTHTEEEIKQAADFLAEIVLRRGGPTPYWQLFVKAPYPRELVIQAVKRLKDSGRVQIVAGVVELIG
ncbi:MAG: hypothetical protein QXV39_04005, partial [Candidatus Caldarchaeum sp.]